MGSRLWHYPIPPQRGQVHFSGAQAAFIRCLPYRAPERRPALPPCFKRRYRHGRLRTTVNTTSTPAPASNVRLNTRLFRMKKRAPSHTRVGTSRILYFKESAQCPCRRAWKEPGWNRSHNKATPWFCKKGTPGASWSGRGLLYRRARRTPERGEPHTRQTVSCMEKACGMSLFRKP